jgi:diphosphomevalonate decarboxylase
VNAGTATAVAHPNIALAKYWGKRDFGHNLPAVPSVSVTLAGMSTVTRVRFDESLSSDVFELAGAPADARRVIAMLDRVRAASGRTERAFVSSENDFPTAAGLASSASAFAALAVAASAAAGLSLSPADASDLARRSSVSAARSAFGGFVELPAGSPGDERLEARRVAPEDHWNLRVIVAVTREGPKETSSTDGMLHTQRTGAYFPAWVESAPAVAARVRAAVLARDLEALGVAAEESALCMHAAAMSARPALVYWVGATVEVLAEVRRLRARGVPAFATIDAGPHVKVITDADHGDEVERTLRGVPGVLRTLTTRPGAGARLQEAAEP